MSENDVYNLYRVQEDFTRRFIQEKYGVSVEGLSEEQRLALVKDYVLHLHQELSSVLQNTSYKMHRQPQEELIHHNIFEEVVDTLKFTLGLWTVLGGDYTLLEKSFRDKSEVVEWRREQEARVEKLYDERVVVLDIDGVLAQYPGPMLDDIAERCGTRFKSVREAKEKLGILVYEELKKAYRISGKKAVLPLVPGAREFIDFLNARQEKVVLISSRPYEKHLNILPDTIHWAQLHNIHFDALYFDDKKGIRIQKRFPKAKIVIDDNPPFINEICSSCTGGNKGKMDIIFFDPEDTGKDINGAIRVNRFDEIMSIMEEKNA